MTTMKVFFQKILFKSEMVFSSVNFFFRLSSVRICCHYCLKDQLIKRGEHHEKNSLKIERKRFRPTNKLNENALRKVIFWMRVMSK